MGEPKRIVLLGKTGSGKSSLANTIFGETLFEVKTSPKSETKECRAETKSINGRNITLIDTPGFFDTNKSEQDLKPEIIKCITECAPGPHAFLILLKVERYTDQERDVIKKITESFSEEVFKYSTVVFTYGDQLEEEQTIEEFVHEEKNLMKLVKKCGDRCHVIDNKYWKEEKTEKRSNKLQVDQLLKTIDKMIEENKDGYYSNEMLQAVEEELQRERERIRQSAGNMSEEEINERAKKNVCKKLLIALTGIGTGVLIGAFFGVKILIKGVLRVLKEIITVVKGETVLKLVAGVATAGATAAVGGVVAAAGAKAGVATAGAVAVAEAVAAGVATAAVGEVATAGVATAGAVAAAEATAAGVATAAGAGVGVGAAVGIAAGVCVGAAALGGAGVGGYKGFKAAEKAETVWEAIKLAKEAVTERGTKICDKIDNGGQNSKQKKN